MNSGTRRIVLICFALLWPVAALAAQPAIPDVITSESQADWIAADQLLQPDGKIKAHRPPEAESLPEIVQALKQARDPRPNPEYQQQAASGEQPCDFDAGLIPHMYPQGAEATSWVQIATIAAESGFVVGEVTASRVGMVATEPFTLLQIRVAKGSRSYPGWIYLLYPRAKLTLDGLRLCTTMFGYPEVPQRGSQILMVDPQQYDDAGMTFLVRPDRLFVQQDGKLWTPDALITVSEDEVAVETLADVEDRIRVQGR